MKKILMATAAAALLGAPAFAGHITFSFANDDGEKASVMDFDYEVGTVMIEGLIYPFSADDVTGTICVTGPESTDCLTIPDTSEQPDVGVAYRYTTDNGNAGWATVISLTE